MPVTGHDNESKQRKYHSQSPQSQRPSLQQILPLPSPCNRRDTEPRRRRLVLHVSRRRIPSGLELWWLHSFFLLHFWHLPVRGNNNVGTEKVCSVFMFVDWDGILMNGKKKKNCLDKDQKKLKKAKRKPCDFVSVSKFVTQRHDNSALSLRRHKLRN